ncbi:MAG TPA: transporter substrate-binding domain-containing protein, partial [Victivallales bacterium]|nr:transporter substrate-binding domain-containing protein [Victivallales bacterium]
MFRAFRIKSLYLFCVLPAITFLSSTSLFSENQNDIPKKSRNPAISSASEIDYPPFCLLNKDGAIDGFSIELMQASLSAMNREVNFKVGSWSEVKGMLERGEIEALPLVGRTPEREEIFDFSFPYMSLYGAIVVRKDNSNISCIDDLKGKKVAVMKNDNAEEFLRREDRGIEIHTTTSFVEAFQQLAKGFCDAVVVQRLVALRLIAEGNFKDLKILDKPIEEFRQDFCFAVKKG